MHNDKVRLKLFDLNNIDSNSVRSLRACITAIMDGKTPDKKDSDKVKELESQAIAKRNS